MKKCIPLLLVLCLLLSGCLAQPTPSVEKPAPVTPTEYYTPYYTDSSLRGLQADVTYSSDAYVQVGRLNNLYGNGAQTLYDTLDVSHLSLSQLPIPDTGWVRLSFSTAAGEKEEIFTLYENNLVVATHRVVKVDSENRQFTTKGDANETEDVAPVHFNNFIGIPKFSIPLLGYVSAYIQQPPGSYIAIALGATLLTAVFLPDLLKKKPEPAENKKEEETK